MVCKYCETENVDDAVFCKACGKRIDGKTICPRCGKLNDDDSVFCVHCGARIDGKKQCASCGTVFEGRYCPHCGVPSTKAKSGGASSAGSGWRNPVNLIGGIMLFLAALSAFAFVFCIGFSAMGQTVNIWHYFGKAYEETGINLDGLNEYSSFYELNQYLPSVICTLLSAAVLVAVITLTVLALIRFVRNLTGKTEKTVDRFAFSAYFVYLAGVTALFAVHYASVSIDGLASATVKTCMNGATVAGISLGAVFLGLGVGCRIAVYGKELQNRSVLLKLICATVGFVFLALAWTYAAQAAGIAVAGSSVSSSGGKSKLGVGFMMIVDDLTASCVTQKLEGTAVSAYALSLTALALEIALIVLFALIAIRRARNFSEKGNAVLGLSIAAFAVALVYLIVSVFAINSYCETLGVGDFTVNYAPAVVCLIFSGLNLATSIVQRAVGSTFRETDPNEELS